jgi:Carbohydrate binding domain
MRKICCLLLLCTACAGYAVSANNYTNRWVWIFGWNLNTDGDVAEITRVLESGAAHGINGAVISCGMDSLSAKTAAFSRRLDEVQRACERLKLELIPAGFGVGYGGTALRHNKYLAEGLPVADAPFLVQGRSAQLVPDASVGIVNGGFEEFQGSRFNKFNFHDQPGAISFVDTEVKHDGKASLRMENFTANPHGHGRVMQEVHVLPHRCYRVGVWVKTENLQPAGSFAISVLNKDRSIASLRASMPPTSEWKKVQFLFNSATFDTVRLYAGIWGGKSGKFWLDDWTLEEVGPLNVLRRPGTPVTVRSADGATTYAEGRDYEPLIDPTYTPNNIDRSAPPLKLTPGSRIQDGERLRVNWYHSLAINNGQVSLCMAEPELYEIFDAEAKHVLLNMDEIRMGGTCAACRSRNMGELLGECITKQKQILRKYIPGVEVLIWGDMLDPNQNAHGNYYLVEGDFTGSWKHIPKDLTIAVWGGEPRAESLNFFVAEGFATLVACYYDADDLKTVKGWLKLADQTPKVRGLMYTPWQKKYGLLPAFGDLLK